MKPNVCSVAVNTGHGGQRGMVLGGQKAPSMVLQLQQVNCIQCQSRNKSPSRHPKRFFRIKTRRMQLATLQVRLAPAPFSRMSCNVCAKHAVLWRVACGMPQDLQQDKTRTHSRYECDRFATGRGPRAATLSRGRQNINDVIFALGSSHDTSTHEHFT